ncbi:NAD-dependent epimerase [Bacillus cereus group sp. TH43LC]|uniref:NAD-dependent epimerase n=1 Tax=Bacillus cereus group TaxID=86661 RepID=UPI0022DFCB6C|nr:NAD-dependent epimerase [Bacillus cereus group sp. TH43LC]MDA1502284.1 NAD-dependent epimerase [Bacillus cereus group sp. TH43LC]
MRILVTGAAGFIGFHLSKRLDQMDYEIIGIDNVNDYYEKDLKNSRIDLLKKETSVKFYECDLCDRTKLEEIFKAYNFDVVINLAAQAGVRYSLENPQAYIDSNIVGFTNILENSKNHNIKHLIYASSSSVYGANTKMPFSVHDGVNHPVSLYAATKKSNELMAHVYSHLYGLPTTGLRFFTVYGPWGRPDMAYYKFTKDIMEGNTIKVYNYGKMRRDFTYIDDIVEGIVRLINTIPTTNSEWNRESPDPSTSYAPYKVYNIGNNEPVELISFINTLEKIIGKKANIEFMPMQSGDVVATYADIRELQDDTDFVPSTNIEIGLQKFVDWYKEYYK